MIEHFSFPGSSRWTTVMRVTMRTLVRYPVGSTASDRPAKTESARSLISPTGKSMFLLLLW